MQHFHVGLEADILRCSAVHTLAAKQINSLVHGIAMDLEDGCRLAPSRCGVCGWCKNAAEVWSVYRTQIMMPVARITLASGFTASWELPWINDTKIEVWVAPSTGDYASCTAVKETGLRPFSMGNIRIA
jgi:hypothetical protein